MHMEQNIKKINWLLLIFVYEYKTNKCYDIPYDYIKYVAIIFLLDYSIYTISNSLFCAQTIKKNILNHLEPPDISYHPFVKEMITNLKNLIVGWDIR